MSLPSDEQTALLWPIKAQGAVTRLSPAGNPLVASVYSNSMEQGRFLESSIADANTQLMQAKQELLDKITIYSHMNSLAVDGQLSHTPRVPKYIADSISLLQTAQQLQQEVTGIVGAINQNIQQILTIEASMLQMVQANLNSLANLLNNICNWGLPALPSIPNLFPDTVWNWNGFQFSPLALFAALKSNTSFNFNFTFANCSLGPTAPPGTLTAPNPSTITTASGLTYGAQNNYQPPLGGQAVTPGQDLTDPVFIQQMQGQTGLPIYGPNFNPNTSMYGAVPDPHTIIDNYQMPAVTYTSNIVSICPQLRPNTVFVTDADYSNPNYTIRNPQLRKDLVHFVTLADIIASNYDPYIVSAWLIYMNLARNGREGVWLPNFQAVYNTYLQPSIATLNVQPVPWNDVLGQTNYIWMGSWNNTIDYVQNDVVVFNGVNYVALVANTGAEPDTNPTDWGTPPAGTIYSDAPIIAFSSTLQALPSNQLVHLLWQLSYVEAGILGYTRNSQWDTNQDTTYLTGPTGSSLDYVPTVLTAAQSSLILGQGTAEFPVPITFPTAMKGSLDQVIALATLSIQGDLNYLSPRLGNRYTYNQFAVATLVDRFSQFWRDFSTNLTAFLAQDPYLIQFAITYPEILDGAIDPLASASNVAAYQSLLQDVATRNRSWVPGTPLLTIPIQPVVAPFNNSTPDANTNGWIDNADLDPTAFLARPDIQALPIPVQTAMLRTNLSYAGLNKFKNQFQTSVANNIAAAQAAIAASQQVGFEVESASDLITATSITSNVLTVLVNNAYETGDNVLLEGTAESFLNGQVVTVLVASATQFTANFSNANYSNPSDTGTTGLVTYVPTGTVGTFVNFDTTVFDDSGNVTTLRPGLFTIQTAGTYNGAAQFNWEVSGAGTITINILQNSNVIATASATSTAAGALQVSLTFVQQFNTDDVVQVNATHNFAAQQIINGNSYFTMTESASSSSSTPTNMNDEVRSYNLDVPFYITPPVPFLTVIEVDSNGNVTPSDPTVPAITNIAISGNVLTVTTNSNNFVAGDLVVFSGLGTATFLDGVVVTVLAGVTTTAFTANYTHANYGPTADTGSVLYAIDSSGAVLAPNPDGIMLTSGSQGTSVSVGVLYGGQYQVAGTPGTFTPGALLYVGPDGLITQDYTTLVTLVGWIICIGRVTAFDGSTNTITFIYEPHVPTRFASMV